MLLFVGTMLKHKIDFLFPTENVEEQKRWAALEVPTVPQEGKIGKVRRVTHKVATKTANGKQDVNIVA